MITQDQVLNALESLEKSLGETQEDEISKATETDLTQPEGADLGNPEKESMASAAKSEDGDDDQGDDLEMSKSFGEELPEEIQTKIDVSDFLKSLVDHTASTIDGLREQVAKSDLHTESKMVELTETVSDIVKSQAKIGIVLKAICQQLGVLGNAPVAAPKAETIAKSEGATERNFNSGLAAEEAPAEEKMFKSLSDNPAQAKSQISNALCDLVVKGEAQDMDVIGFETSGYLRPEVVTKLKTVL